MLYSNLTFNSLDVSSLSKLSICLDNPSNVLLNVSLCVYSSINLFDKLDFLFDEYANHSAGAYNGNVAQTILGVSKINVCKSNLPLHSKITPKTKGIKEIAVNTISAT